MSSVGSDASSFRKSLSVFEKRQSNRSLETSSSREYFSMFGHRHSLGSSASFEVPPAFRSSLNIFEDSEERNPLLPSFFRDDEGNIVRKPCSSNEDLKKEFEFSLKHAKLQEGPYLSLQQIIGFQSRFRGYLVRKVYKNYKMNIVKLQALGRGFFQRKRFHAIVQASIRCQSIVRRYLVQREARRLYDIQNPPQIRKLRDQIAVVQQKLDAINEERERMNKERERRKAQIKKDCLERFAKMERDKTLGIAHVQKSGSQLISYFQTENNALRATMRELARNIADLRSENKSLERDNQVVGQYTHELHTHYKKMRETNGSLQNQVDKLRNRCKPKYEDAINARENHVINETRQKYIYRQGLFRIVDNVLLDQSCDSDFKDGIARVVGRCEADFDCELDIDTPLELYPVPPEQKSMLSAFKPDDEKSTIDAEEDGPFEFLDDADFLLPGLLSFNPRMDADDTSSDDSSSTSSSASSTSSDSSSSTDSSNDGSQMSDQSFRERSADSDSPKDVATYFEQNNASTISPITKKHLNESSSTVCSTDESEYEVQSVSDNTEGCDAAKIVADDEVESDSDSGTATSMPPWETNDDPNVPVIICIPSDSELDGKVQDSASTASTAAIESESSSSYVDVDIMDSRNGSLEQPIPVAKLEPAENAEVDLRVSSLRRKEPNSTLYHRSASSCDSELKEEHKNIHCGQPKHSEKQKAKTQPFKDAVAKSLPTRQVGIKMSSNTVPSNTVPRATPRPPLSKTADEKQQRFGARIPAPARSKPKTPFRTRQTSTKPTFANQIANTKPFRARPAPKFGEPKIAVRGRDPSKLRSKSQTPRAMSPQKSQ